MLSTRSAMTQALVLIIAIILSACASNNHKRTVDKPQKVLVEAKPYDFRKMKRRPLPKETFGDDPYLQYAPHIPPEVISEYQFSVKALQGGNQDLGELQLKNMLDEYSSLSGPAYNLAVLNKDRGNIEKSLEYLHIAMDRNQYNYAAKNLYGSIMREQGDFAAAEQAYNDILALWGGYAPAYKSLGILYDLYLGQPESAVVFYRQYNELLDAPDSQVSGWIVDIERRYGLKQTLQEHEVEQMREAEQLAADALDSDSELEETVPETEQEAYSDEFEDEDTLEAEYEE